MTAVAARPVGSLGRGALDALRTPSLLGVGFVYVFATAGSAQKYVGTAVSVLLLLVTPVVAMAIGGLLAVARSWPWPLSPDLTAAVVAVAAVAAMLVVYPLVNTHVPGSGSDRDDAATIGARSLFHLNDPYGLRTYLDSPISQLPTLLAIAAPFAVLFGSSAYQLVVWIPLAYLFWRAVGGSGGAALAVFVVALSSPSLQRDILTGGDLLPNVVLVAAAAWLAWRWAGVPRREPGGAVLLGLALATRANALFLLVPLLVSIGLLRGTRAAARIGGVALAVFAALTVPLAFTHGGREALSMNDKLSHLPGGSASVLVVGLVCALVISRLRPPRRLAQVFAQAAVVQILFVVALVLDTSIQHGRPDFYWLVSSYGAPVLVLSLTGLVAP